MVIAAHLREKPGAVRLKKIPTELKGIIVQGQRPFTICVQLYVAHEISGFDA
jgi:hypothetical protein